MNSRATSRRRIVLLTPVGCERPRLRPALRPAAAALALPDRRGRGGRALLCSLPPSSCAAAKRASRRCASPCRRSATTLAERLSAPVRRRRLLPVARSRLFRRAGRLGQQPAAGHRLGDLVGRRHLRQRADRRRLAPHRSVARRRKAVRDRAEPPLPLAGSRRRLARGRALLRLRLGRARLDRERRAAQARRR